MTSPAIKSPATDGVNALLPGDCFFDTPFLVESENPCGFSFREFSTSSGIGAIAFFVDYTHFNRLIPRFFSSLRMTRAKGHTEVLEISATLNCAGSTLLPAPIELIMGFFNFFAFNIRSSFAVTVSIQSTM